MENPQTQAKDGLNPSRQLAMAMAILESTCHSKFPLLLSDPARNPLPSPPRDPLPLTDLNCTNDASNNSESDAIKWKRKAKQRKEEILRLKEDLKIAEDGIHHDVFPQNVSCKCYFYDSMGQQNPTNESDGRFNDVLQRRFLRQVRLTERKRRRSNGSLRGLDILDSASQIEQLRASVDFLVELCENSSPVRVEEGNFKNWSHQAVDFIHATINTLSATGRMDEKIESIVNSLTVRMVCRMCKGSEGDEMVKDNIRVYVQHLLRKLGRDPYVGQRVILAVSERISAAAESLLFMDPFDRAFPRMHNCMFTMIQLIEFLISDYLLSWSTSEDFDLKLLEEWVISVFHARKSLELLESRNTLYMLYMDRVIGELTRRMGQTSVLQKLRPDTLAKLF